MMGILGLVIEGAQFIFRVFNVKAENERKFFETIAALANKLTGSVEMMSAWDEILKKKEQQK